MKKSTLLLGGIVGFLLGSYAGRGPYERVEAWARKLRRRPEVRRVADQVTESAGHLGDVATSTASKAADHASEATADAVEAVADRVTETIGHVGNGNGGHSSSSHSHPARTAKGEELKSEK
jgi:gas vesicle protein